MSNAGPHVEKMLNKRWFLSLFWDAEMGGIVILILQMRKLRPREWLAQCLNKHRTGVLTCAWLSLARHLTSPHREAMTVPGRYPSRMCVLCDSGLTCCLVYVVLWGFVFFSFQLGWSHLECLVFSWHLSQWWGHSVSAYPLANLQVLTNPLTH